MKSLIILNILFIILIILIINKNKNKNIEKFNSISIRFICLCTKNYDKIGCYGVNSIKYYCKKHKYNFTFYRNKLIEDLHINFSKNAIILDACKKYNDDYFVCIDTDIAIKDLDFKIESLIKPGHVIYAPRDIWRKNGKKNSIINMGFSIWKNCKRTEYINKKWIDAARKDCKHLSNKHPRQQNVFDSCVFKLLKKNELKLLDHKLVGLPYSKIISQTKKPKKYWEKIGSPNYKLCKLNN